MGKVFSNADMQSLCDHLKEHSRIDQNLYTKFHIKRGLRRSDGTGVLAGITNICNVHGYVVNEGEVEPIPGELIYRGYDSLRPSTTISQCTALCPRALWWT